MRAGHRHAMISVLFGLVLALICAEIVYVHHRSEPYPGIFQPSFGSVPLDAATEIQLEPQVTVIERDGSRRLIDYRSLLPPATGVLESTVFRSAFSSPSRAQAPQTKAWLAARLRMVQGNDDATTLVIQWQLVRYSLSTGRRTVQADDRRLVVDVRGAT